LRRVAQTWPEVTSLTLLGSELCVSTSPEAPSEDQHLAAANALCIAEEVLGCALALHWVEDPHGHGFSGLEARR
jgi:hypothetical protein